MKKRLKNHKKIFLITGALLLTAIMTAAVFLLSENGNEETVYRETKVQKGELTVGIEASGSVEIGTRQQTFELDLSEYVSSTDTASISVTASGSMPGAGMNNPSDGNERNPFSQLAALMGSGNNAFGDSNTMEIAEVCVTEGEVVQAGDVIYRLTDDSITDIREQLENDVSSAKADLDMLEAENKISSVSAQNTYNLSSAYGSYAQSQYDQTLYEARKKVTDLEEQVAQYEEDLTTRQEELALLQEEFSLMDETAKAFQWSVDNMSSYDETALYLEYENTRETAQKNADTLDSSIEQTENMIENIQNQLTDLNRQLAQAKRELETAQFSAKETYELSMLQYRTAQETYDITTGSLEFNYKQQQDDYNEAEEKLKEFDSNISGNSVVAQYDGTITELPLAVGDTISTGTVLMTVYDKTDTTITVSVDDTDIKSLEKGGNVNISFIAYPDIIFRGVISGIDDAETDSNGDVSYPVTVFISGDVSGLYAGMTGDLTFITKETEEVLFVSNRAIFRNGARSFVKVRENGKVVEKDVSTGFSDGENVEIKDGLSEGDTVLIESKVNGS